MNIFSLFKKKRSRSQYESLEKGCSAPYLTQTVVFGMHRYRQAGEDSSVYLVDPQKNLSKMIVDSRGQFKNFPGIQREKFWTDMVDPNAIKPQIRFRTSFEKCADGWRVLWEIQPDGRYWEDEDGFGGNSDQEVVLSTVLDTSGSFTGPFRIYSLGNKYY